MAIQSLVIDDEPHIRAFVSEVLQGEGWEVTEADSAENAFQLLREREWQVVFCDVLLGGDDGFAVLRRFKEELPQAKVVLMTGHGSATGALDATAFGAYDYILKPFGVDALKSLSRDLAQKLAKTPHVRLASKRKRGNALEAEIELVGRSSSFIEIMKQVGRVATTNLSVFLVGESGTGKGVVASALHRRSQRSEKPFVAVNCGAIPGDLIESELFGHLRGSFTGADRDRIGLWAEADGGTIFLDEVTETTPSFQVKLLRAVQQGEIRKVGSNQTEKIDVRVIAASNRNVEEEVAAGRFRQDLFYRLNAVSITLPPLRERREDILPLAKAFAERAYSLNPSLTFSGEALQLFQKYPWPGNIRELENAIVRAATMSDGTIRPQDLPEQVRNYQAQKVSPTETETRVIREWMSLAEMESGYVARVLRHTKGNKVAASRLLEVDRKTLDRMIKRHNISLETLVRQDEA